MKTKFLVALVSCLALAACNKGTSNKEENKVGSEQETTTTTTTEQHKDEHHHSGMVDKIEQGATELKQDATNATHDIEQKTDSMAHGSEHTQNMAPPMQHQDLTNTQNQMQGETTTTGTTDTTTQTHQ